MMKDYSLITPEGTQDFLFAECAVRRSIEQKIEAIWQSRGYTEVITPVVEFFDVFNQQESAFPQEQMYKLVDSKGRLLVIRPDSTMPIARMVATRLREEALPLRLYYNQCIYLNSPLLKGRSNQIAQTGIELIGSSSRLADLEVISAAIDVLDACAVNTFSLELGDIGIFKELMRQLKADAATEEQIRLFIEEKNYPALADLLDTIGDNEVTRALKKLPRLFGGAEVFEKAATLFTDPKITALLDNLRTVYADAAALCSTGCVTVDLGMVGRTDYYTGIILKGYLSGCGDAVLSGGRYDKLLAAYGYDVPATGFAVHIDAVSGLHAKLGKAAAARHCDVLVFAPEGCATQAIRKAQELRAQGKIVELALQETLEAAREYAKENAIATVVVADTNEEDA